MILTKAVIINFQSHKRTVIEFTDGVNGLIGSSNSGKSSAFRAIRWNLLNQPSGHRFIRNGESETTVITYWSSGHAIERTRSRGSKNYYAVYKDGVLLEEFTGFGSNVPEKVSEITRIWDGFLNFSNQLEAPFLLAETPKKRAETIGNVEELGKIDVEITSVNQEINELKKDEKRLLKELQAEKKKLSKLEIEIEEEQDKVAFLNIVKQSIEEKNQLVHNLERNQHRVLEVQSELNETAEMVEKAKRITSHWDATLPSQVDVSKSLMQMHAKLHNIEREMQDISFLDKKIIKEITSMTDYILDLKSTFHILERFHGELLRLQRAKETVCSSFNPTVAQIDISPTDIEIEKYTTLFRKHKRLKEIEVEQMETQRIIDETKTKITALLQEFVVNLKDMEYCPTCHQTTNNVTTEGVEKALI